MFVARRLIYGAAAVLLGIGSGSTVSAQPSEIRAQPSEIRFDRVEGLSHNTVFAILQDRRGFMWIGTSDGLNRYDGYRMEHFRHSLSDTSTIRNNVVRALWEDDAGHLWVGTETGVDALDRRTGSFVHHDVVETPRVPGDALPSVFVLQPGPFGTLWVGATKYLTLYDPARRIATPADGVPVDLTWYSSSVGVDGTLWISFPSGERGIFRRSPDAEAFERFAVPDLGPGLSILAGRSGTVWIASDGAVATLDPKTGTITRRFEAVGGQHILEDRDGNLWLGGGSGLWKLDVRTGAVTKAQLGNDEANWLVRRVQAIFEDDAGSIWAGTLGGLFRFDPHRPPFRLVQRDPANEQSLSSNTVTSIHRSRDGALWVGTLGGGLNRLDGAAVRRYRHRGGEDKSLCHDNVWSILEDEGGRIWLGTDAGLCSLDPSGTSFRLHDLGLSEPYVNTIEPSAARGMWIGGTALIHLDPMTGKVEHHSTEGLNIQAIYEDTSGTVWLGTEFTGLWRYDPKSGDLTAYPAEVDGEVGIRGKGVRVIEPDIEPGVLWLGTDLGLGRFERASGTFSYPFSGRLPGSHVYAILHENDRRLWVTTNNGLTRIDRASGDVRTFDASDGTGNVEFNRRAAFADGDGMFYLGGLDGLTVFRPAAIRTNTYVPPVVLTDIRAFGPKGPRLIRPEADERVVINPAEHTLVIDFAALNYTNSARNEYAYFLDGFDHDWVNAGTSREARYVGVPPGRYTFRVRGSNNDGVWNERGAALAVVVLPSFWQTWWFRFGVAVLLLAGIVAAYQYRVRHLLEIERMRMRIAADLHDEIGTGLSSVALLSDMVSCRDDAGDEIRSDARLINRVARDLVVGLKEIVWFVNPDHDQPDDLIRKMKQTAGAVLNGTDVCFEVDSKRLLEGIDVERRRDLYLIYKEAVHNVARHAGASVVRIRFWDEGGMSWMRIRDDGAGFLASGSYEGNGLRNMRLRAKHMGCTLEIQSTAETGTTLLLGRRIT